MKEKWPVTIVKIFGEDYSIRGVKDSEYIKKLAGYLDKKMRETAANAKLNSSNKIAILAALNITDELYKSREKHKAVNDRVREKVRNLVCLISEAKK